ncbi:DUF1559 domain-containing protein [Stieleria sp. ICT_E10.1]|uniref:DUF1559 domain-containing protein n=1 Tax=Stieleria sedimenti TaxID=2976331 RepID=UPI0021803B75|nr:DUF1559 domain-containing protein [Stieleria sedimenti]MCS7470356.1 DUF1559 domain-containing protein [Stieleria sedimenti]
MSGLKHRITDDMPRFFCYAALVCLLGVIQGCGESQQDLFLKHAQRDRGGGAANEEVASQNAAEQPAKPSNPIADPVVAKPRPPIVNTSVASSLPKAGPTQDIAENEADASDAGTGLAETIGIKPISQRQPETELTTSERRRRAFDNLQQINEALTRYVDEKGHYPKSYATNSGGVPTLSWRVELLPYLGYEALYKQFDFSRAWNMQPNKDLLQYIPDAFVSPERFDVKTNYQLPIDSAFIFGENRAITPAMIDDGPENTIMLLEVNDAHAVHWTEPKDFDPKSPMAMSPYVGKLRVDGTFALWANGFPVLLENGLSDAQLFQAMTYEKSDALRAGDIHRAITVEQAEDDPETEASLAPEQVADTAEDIVRPQVDMGIDLPLMVDEPAMTRDPVPSAIELTAAQDKLREIFRDKIQEAKGDDDRRKLAAEFISLADDMEADPAGAFALQQAAIRLAIEANDGTLLIKAIDQRVARFELDSFRENLKWIQAFGGETASRDASLVKGDGILKRSIPVIYAGIRENEYMLASSVTRIANRFTGSNREDKVSRLLTRLRTQLGAAKREYDNSVDDLERFRNNPDDVAAGAAFGSFLCFIKGDWQTGLPLVADGTGGDLVEVAKMDLRGASRAIDQVALGDAWWELSRRGSGAYRQGAEDRAVMWYSQAIVRLPESLDRIHVENRLKEADEADARSPIALCIQLADEIGIDLRQSLTSIAAKGGRMARRNDDD